MDVRDALDDYHHDQRWLKGVKPPAQGRRWERGKPGAPQPQRLAHCLITPPGALRTPKGAPALTYTIKQLLPADGWQARYAEADGTPFTERFEFFALCEVIVEGQTQSAMLAVEYTTEDGWCLIQGHDNFLALIPPWEAA